MFTIKNQIESYIFQQLIIKNYYKSKLFHQIYFTTTLNTSFLKDALNYFSALSVKRIIKDFNKESVKRFAKTYEFCSGDINKFILLLRKGVYPYEYMHSWERFNEKSLSDKNLLTAN